MVSVRYDAPARAATTWNSQRATTFSMKYGADPRKSQ